MELQLNTIRLIAHDQAKEYAFCDFESLHDNIALGFLNPEDYKKLNLQADSHIKLSNSYGKIVLGVKQDENVPQGIINVPISIWANQITGIEQNNLIYKNISVNVEVTNNPILELNSLIKSIKEE